MKALDDIQNECYEKSYWEDLRNYYKPTEIKVLIIGEDIPDGMKRFFYYDKVKNYDHLYIDTIKAIFPKEYKKYNQENKRLLLHKFKDMGCYLIDVYPFPKSLIKNNERIYIEKFLKNFSILNLNHNCEIIILNSVGFIKNYIPNYIRNITITPYNRGSDNKEYISIIRNTINKLSNGE